MILAQQKGVAHTKTLKLFSTVISQLEATLE